VEGTVSSLKRLGCDLRLCIYDDEDHYLLVSRPDVVLGEIRACMTAD
jgi:hypothetical protein